MSETLTTSAGRSDSSPARTILKLGRRTYLALASAKLAMALLVLILICCVVGVTFLRGPEANARIFSTVWFNALLVLLVANVAFCFFGRIWGRRVTVVSFGMILFHLSFVTVFLGVVYNSLFYFRGNIRLTEGETLSNSDPKSYDQAECGRFFSYSRLKGDTSLVSLLPNYQADGKNKRVAYEVAVGDGADTKRGIIYVTKFLEFHGVKYFRDKEGYSLLVVLSDKDGKELYGAYLPLQSYKQKDSTLRYATGTRTEQLGLLFPQDSHQALFDLLLAYRPSPLKERQGEVDFQVKKYDPRVDRATALNLGSGRAAIGERFAAGGYDLAVKEVRYWVAMQVAHEPGQPIILSSLWVGLFGVTLTTLGRIFRKRRSAA